MEVSKLNRREFLKRTGLVGAAGALYSVSGCGEGSQPGVEPWLYLSVGSDTLGFVLPRTEMGQDLATSFVMILSDVMALPVARFSIAYAKADVRYGQQMTVGSGSVRGRWGQLRSLGTQVRVLVESRAAKQLDCAPSDLIIANGKVAKNGELAAIDYLSLLAEGWPEQLPQGKPAASNSEVVVGSNTLSVLAADKVTGRFNYVADEVLDEKVASVALTVPYRVGGVEFNPSDLENYRKTFGLDAVFDLGAVGAGYGAIALVAAATWPLIQCKKTLAAQVKAKSGQSRDVDSLYDDEIKTRESALNGSGEGLEMVFTTPPIPHAPMETESSVAEFDGKACRVWAPTQAPQFARKEVAEALSISEENVDLQTVPAGGAFGRKRYSDFVVESVLISKGLYQRKLNSKVKLLWLREDDLARELYRPQSWQSLSWHPESPDQIAYQLLESRAPGSGEKLRKYPKIDFLGWQFSGQRKEVPGTTFPAIWRAVEHGYMGFALNSFVDEMSYKHSQDPIDYFSEKIARLSLMESIKGMVKAGNNYSPDRILALIDKVREMSAWGDRETPQNSGVGYGFSAYTCFKSYIALVAKVAVVNGQLTVEKVWAAVDCGIAINPDGVKAQIEGGIIYGMSACLWGEAPNAAASFGPNFNDYQVARMKDVPDIEIAVVESSASPTGVGELAVPVIAPAIANAVRSTVGTRLTSMPFLSSGALKR